MSERYCVGCGRLIILPHIRVWEENNKISHMLTFCNYRCLSIWIHRNTLDILLFRKNLDGRKCNRCGFIDTRALQFDLGDNR